MKKTIVCTFLAAAIATSAMAKPMGWNADPEKMEARHEQRVEKIISKLELDEARAAEAKTILDDSFASLSAHREQVREQINGVITERNNSLANLLTAEQLEQVEKFGNKMRHHMSRGEGKGFKGKLRNWGKNSNLTTEERQIKALDKVMAKLELEESSAAEVRTVLENSLTEMVSIRDAAKTAGQSLREAGKEKLSAMLSAEEIEVLESMRGGKVNKGAKGGKRGKNATSTETSVQENTEA